MAGLRACEKKGFLDWVADEKADIICLQEVKALPEQLSAELVLPEEYIATYAPAQRKGYSGVATWIKKDLKFKNTVGIKLEKFDSEGRTLISEFDKFILFNCYFPNGQRDHGRVPYKLEYCRELTKYALKMSKKLGKPLVITGDYNTAHHEIDLANPKANIKTTGFLPIERQWMDEYQAQGFVDAFRKFTPEENGHYTWWTFRNNCRERNIGWRIDYFWVYGAVAKQMKSCYHRTEVHGSDHCPIILEL